MRDLELRAWNTLKHRWEYSNILHGFGNGLHLVIDLNTLGQVSGLVDGVRKIYEGDILHYTDTEGYGPEEVTYGGYYIVQWDENNLQLNLFDPFSGDWWPLADTNFDGIIGNIHENPNLVELK